MDPALLTLLLSIATVHAENTTAAPAANDTLFNATGVDDCSSSAWIGTLVSAGLFIVSEVLPFISKSPSNGILHTIVNGLKGAQKK